MESEGEAMVKSRPSCVRFLIRKSIFIYVFISLLISLFLPVWAVARPDLISATRASEKISKWCAEHDGKWFQRLAQLGVKASIRKEFDFLGNLTGFGYNYRVKPAYTNGLFTRQDRVVFEVGNRWARSILNPLKNFEPDFFEADEVDADVGLSLEREYELIYYRHFTNACQAETAFPYLFKEFPRTAKRVIQRLSVGDYVTWKSGLGLVVGSNFLRDIGVDHFPLDASIFYQINGRFQIHLLKIGEKKVRLKLVGVKDRGEGYRAGVGYDDVWEITPVRLINKRITKILNLNPIRFKYTDGMGELVAVDYIMNLGAPEIEAAYNSLMEDFSPSLSDIPTPVRPIEDVNRKLILKMIDIEDLYQRERMVKDELGPSYDMRVVRTLKGTLQSFYSGGSWWLGIKLAKVRFDRGCSKEHLMVHDANEQTTFYRIDSCSVSHEGEFLFEWRYKGQTEKMDFLFKADDNYNRLEGVNFVFPVRYEDKRFSAQDLVAVKDQLRSLLPAIIYDRIEFEEKWKQGNKRLNIVGLNYRTTFAPTILDYLPKLNEEEIYEGLKAYMYRFLPRSSVSPKPGMANSSISLRIKSYELELRKVAKSFAIFLDSSEGTGRRIRAFKRLNANKAFRLFGLGYLMSLIASEEELKQVVRFDLSMTALEGNAIKFSYGNAVLSPIYIDIQNLRGLFQNNGFDVLLASEDLKNRRAQFQF